MKPGFDIKKDVSGYLKWVESEESTEQQVQSPSWEMNNCELTRTGKYYRIAKWTSKQVI